jgi:hypothetical protein
MSNLTAYLNENFSDMIFVFTLDDVTLSSGEHIGK